MASKALPDFYDDYEDPVVRKRAEQHALETYRKILAQAEMHHKTAVDYGKWVVAGLLAIHFGSIAIISQLDTYSIRVFLLVGHLHIAGIVLALMCGFFVWINFYCLSNLLERWSNPAMLYRYSAWPKNSDSKFDPIGGSFCLSIGFGLVSLFLFVLSGAELFDPNNAITTWAK